MKIKKIIISVFVIVALSILFSISCFAWEEVPITPTGSYDFTYGFYFTLKDNSSVIVASAYGNDKDSSNYLVLIDTTVFNIHDLEFVENYCVYHPLTLNIPSEDFAKEVIVTYQMASSDVMADTVSSIYNSGYDFGYSKGKADGVSEYKESEEYSNAINEAVSEALENAGSITEEDLQIKYEEGYAQGEIDGVTEYKQSEEYTIAINNSYSNGYTTGVSDYKKSDGYATALSTQYSIGKTAGVSEYKASVEFMKTLKAEYNEGYDNGVADTQGQAVKNEVTKLLSIFIGVLGFGIILMAVLGVASKFKKKAKRR